MKDESKPTKPGLYPDMPYDEYRADPAVAKSDLDLVNESPAQLLWKKNAPVDTSMDDAGEFGTAFHAFVLEPEKYSNGYIVEPKIDKRTNAGKQAHQDFIHMTEGKTVLSAKDGVMIKMMRDSVMAHPTAKQIIESADHKEVSVFYKDVETGIMCKTRMDIIASSHSIIADLKTTKAITKWLYRDILDYRYHIQECHYSRAYEAIFGEKPVFLFIFVSKEKTFGQHRVKVVRLSDEFLDVAEADRRRNLLSIKECRESGVYNGIERIFMGGNNG